VEEEAVMKIKVDHDVCISSGACVLEAPEVFDQDDEGLVVLVDDEPPVHLHAAARRALGACPAAVITIEE
jgi:ferredoxin